MTATTNEFYDYNDYPNNSDLFSAWLLGKINANCILSDLSPFGCSVLIPKHQSIPAANFNLLIMSPEDGDRLHTVLKAEQRWQDNSYSLTHSKIGVKFQNLDQDQLQEITTLLQHFNIFGKTRLKCSLLKR